MQETQVAARPLGEGSAAAAPRRKSRPRSATTSSSLKRSPADTQPARTIRERRSSQKALPDLATPQHEDLPLAWPTYSPSTTPTASRSSVSTDNTFDSFRSRSLTVSSASSSRQPSHSLDLTNGSSTRPVKSHKSGRSSSSQHYGFPLPPGMEQPFNQLIGYQPRPGLPKSTSSSTLLRDDIVDSYAPSDPCDQAAQKTASSSSAGTGWISSMARRASGKLSLRRSFSSNASLAQVANEPLESPSAAPRLERADLSSDSSNTSSPVMGSSGGSSRLGGLLNRKKSKDSLSGGSGSEATGANHKGRWSDLPPSPQTAVKSNPSHSASGHGKSVRMGGSKGKLRLDQVPITPFEIRIPPEHRSDMLLGSPTYRRASADAGTSRSRPNGSRAHSLEFHSARSASSASGSPTSSTASRASSVHGSPPPASLSDDAPPPVPPIPLDHPKSPITFHHDSFSSITSTRRRAPPAEPLDLSSAQLNRNTTSSVSPELPTPRRLPTPPSPAASSTPRLRFPTAFGFVPRPEIDEHDRELGTSASAANVPLPYGLPRAASSQISFLSTGNSSENGGHGSREGSDQSDHIVPPRRVGSLLPLRASAQRQRPTPEPSPPQPPAPVRRNKTMEFEELLCSDLQDTMKLSLTPDRVRR